MALIDLVRRFFELPTRAERDAKRLNVKLDAELFMRMCRTLYEQAPKDSPLLVMDARLPLEKNGTDENGADDCALECYVKKSSGKNVRFAPSAEARADLCARLRELRDSMERQKQPRWKGLKLTVDVPADKYNADFKY